MEQRSGVDEAGNRWTQIDIGEVVLDRSAEPDGGEWEGAVKVFLWRRVPERPLQLVIEHGSEQLSFESDAATRLADELPGLLRAAAVRAQQE